MKSIIQVGRNIFSFPVKQLHRNSASESPRDRDRSLGIWFSYPYWDSGIICMRWASPSSSQGADRQCWKGCILVKSPLEDLCQFPFPSCSPTLCDARQGRETAKDPRKRPLLAPYLPKSLLAVLLLHSSWAFICNCTGCSKKIYWFSVQWGKLTLLHQFLSSALLE